MARLELHYTFLALSLLSIYLMLIQMVLNGSFMEMFTASLRGTLPTGTPLRTTWTKLWPIDVCLGLLVAFYSSVVDLKDLPDVGPYLMTVDLVFATAVLFQMVLIESRRNRFAGWRGSLLLWQYVWICLPIGIASSLPVFLHWYLKRSATITGSPMVPTTQAQAFPFAAIWNCLVVPAPLLVPPLLGATSFHIQAGVVLWLLGLSSLGIFQDLVSSYFSSTTSASNPGSSIIMSYRIVGGLSAFMHVCVVLTGYFAPEVSLVRIYWPHPELVEPGPSLLMEGAMLFIQYDYILIVPLVLVTELFHSISVSRGDSNAKLSATKKYTMYPIICLTFITAVFGPGAGMAWVLVKEASAARQESTAISKSS